VRDEAGQNDGHRFRQILKTATNPALAGKAKKLGEGLK
jgi:hypothetical protein